MSLFKKSFLFVICFSLLSCSNRVLLTKKQLKGADPHKDLMAAPILKYLKQNNSRFISVRGVKLFDPLERVQALWGNPSRKYGNHYFWLDESGNYLFRVLTGHFVYLPHHAKITINRVVVRQIDVFFFSRHLVHPKNKALFELEKIESSTWRKQIFGSNVKIVRGAIQTRYSYPKKGFQLLLLSKIIPIGKKTEITFSLFLSPKVMRQNRVIPIP